MFLFLSCMGGWKHQCVHCFSLVLPSFYRIHIFIPLRSLVVSPNAGLLIVVKNSKWLPCRFLVVDLLLFLTFHWSTFCHMTPFHTKLSLTVVAIPSSEHVSLSNEGPFHETLKFFAISYGSYHPLKFSRKDDTDGYWIVRELCSN